MFDPYTARGVATDHYLMVVGRDNIEPYVHSLKSTVVRIEVDFLLWTYLKNNDFQY